MAQWTVGLVLWQLRPAEPGAQHRIPTIVVRYCRQRLTLFCVFHNRPRSHSILPSCLDFFHFLFPATSLMQRCDPGCSRRAAAGSPHATTTMDATSRISSIEQAMHCIGHNNESIGPHVIGRLVFHMFMYFWQL